MERGLRALAGTALTEPEKAATILQLNGHAFWVARLWADLERTRAEPRVTGSDLLSRLSFGLDRALDCIELLIAQRQPRQPH